MDEDAMQLCGRRYERSAGEAAHRWGKTRGKIGFHGGVRRVCRNVKHWRDAAMALRWTGAAMLEAAKGFRRLKAHRQLPILKAALAAHTARHTVRPDLEQASVVA